MGLLAFFLAWNRHGGGMRYAPLVDRLKYLTMLDAVRAYATRPEWVAALVLAIAVVAAVAWGLVTARPWRRRVPAGEAGLLLAAAASVVVYFAAPDASAGGSYITLRLSLFPYLLAILWLAGQEIGPAARGGLVAVAAACTVVVVFAQFRAQRAFEPLLRDFCSAAEHVRPGATLLPLVDDARAPLARASPRVRAFHNAAGYLAALRDLVDLRNYEASLGYFPVVYRPELDPTRYLGADPPDVASYLNATGGRAAVDYILVCPGGDGDRVLESLGPAVRAAYRPAYHSPGGTVALYARATGTPSGR
jgi:hypothetical protein